MIASDLLGYGRDPLPPIRDVITDAGDLVVPIDLRAFGHWLRLLFGDPTTTTAAGFIANFVPGTESSMASVEVQNRIKRVEARLPRAVMQQGILIEEASSAVLQIVTLRNVSFWAGAVLCGGTGDGNDPYATLDRLITIDGFAPEIATARLDACGPRCRLTGPQWSRRGQRCYIRSLPRH